MCLSGLCSLTCFSFSDQQVEMWSSVADCWHRIKVNGKVIKGAFDYSCEYIHDHPPNINIHPTNTEKLLPNFYQFPWNTRLIQKSTTITISFWHSLVNHQCNIMNIYPPHINIYPAKTHVHQQTIFSAHYCVACTHNHNKDITLCGQ